MRIDCITGSAAFEKELWWSNVHQTERAANGDYVVAKNHEEEATFKQYKRFDNTKVLHPLNPKYPDIVLNKDPEYRIVGVLMARKKRYK